MSTSLDDNMCCSKCASLESSNLEKNENGDLLCENCNESLIARNLVMELMQHKVKIDEESDKDECENGAEIEVNENHINRRTVETDFRVKRVKLLLERVQVEERIGKDEDEGGSEGWSEDEGEKGEGPITRRRSVRATMNKYKYPDYEPQDPTPPSSRNRRAKAFTKERIIKSASATATTVTSKYVFYKGIYYQLGDIVSLMDTNGTGVYYAQITGLMRDPYAKVSATIQWLLPTKESPPSEIAFDPRTYYLGFAEEVPRPLETMKPVLHAPSDYYKFNDSPFPPINPPPFVNNYIWKNLERVYINLDR